MQKTKQERFQELKIEHSGLRDTMSKGDFIDFIDEIIAGEIVTGKIYAPAKGTHWVYPLLGVVLAVGSVLLFFWGVS